MTYTDAPDEGSGLLTGVGSLTAVPLLLVATWYLERASVAAGGRAVDEPIVAAGVVAPTIAMVLLLAVALVAVHNARW